MPDTNINKSNPRARSFAGRSNQISRGRAATRARPPARPSADCRLDCTEAIGQFSNMGIFPITPLVLKVRDLILETFDVSNEMAENYAAEMVALAEGWGSSESAERLDWPYRIRKDLGETKKLKWRSEEERAKFESVQKQNYAAWDALIKKKPPETRGPRFS
jgi:hypothetical protein